MRPILIDIKNSIYSVLFWKIILILVALSVTPLIPLYNPMTAVRDMSFIDFGLGLPYWIKIWGNFDGFYYLMISKHGYEPGVLPFFPLYPFMIFIFRSLFDVKRIIIGQAISVSSCITALIISLQLFRLDTHQKHQRSALFILIILTFPTAFFYTAIYNDSLFFLLAVITIYAARTRQWTLASCAGFLATLTRLNGIILFPYLILEYVTQTLTLHETWHLDTVKQHIRSIYSTPKSWKSVLTFFLIPAAFIGYLTYIQLVFTNWSYLFSAMKTWGQDKIVLPPQVIWRYIKIFLFSFQPHTFTWWIAVAEFASVMLYISLLVYSWKNIRISYWVFFAFSVLLPWLTGTFQGMPRYGLHIYPMYLILYMWLRSKHTRVQYIYLVIMTLLEIVMLTLFTRGVFIA